MTATIAGHVWISSQLLADRLDIDAILLEEFAIGDVFRAIKAGLRDPDYRRCAARRGKHGTVACWVPADVHHARHRGTSADGKRNYRWAT